uniref:Uncharacterized protein n=1 Tax=Leersia perrieri TaxID=77586 RepID=A0A0D9WQU9_9ORYZ
MEVDEYATHQVWKEVHTQQAMSIDDGAPRLADTSRNCKAARCKTMEDVYKDIFSCSYWSELGLTQIRSAQRCWCQRETK